MKKKALAGILGLTLVFAAGCGAAGSPSGVTPPPEEEPGTEQPAEPVEPPIEPEYPDIPDIPPDEETIPDYELPFDDSQKYNYENDTLRYVRGNFSAEEQDRYTSSGEALAVCQTTPFPYGTISVTVKTMPGTDSGVVFGLTAPQNGTFWEGEGISYYFFFVNREGYAYLGKTDDGLWTPLVSSPIANFGAREYRIKVVRKSNKIVCYLDGEIVFAYRDKHALEGTGYGIRTGIPNVTFSSLTVTNDYLYDDPV